MNLPIGYVGKWQIKDQSYFDPTNRIAVIKVEDFLNCLEEEIEKGNVGDNSSRSDRRGFSAGLFLSELKKEIERAK